MSSFSIRAYLKLIRNRGIWFTFNHFTQDHVFDLIRGTDTHEPLEKPSYKESLDNFEHGTLYMSSWKSVVRKSTKIALDLFPVPRLQVTFVDVGCGKGKVLCIWEKMFRGSAEIIGIEYSRHLAKICVENLKIIQARRSRVIVSDVLKVDIAELGQYPLIYMFNPFDADLMARFLKQLHGVDCCIIYNNHAHHDVILQNGFQQFYEDDSESLNQRFAIYRPAVSKISH